MDFKAVAIDRVSDGREHADRRGAIGSGGEEACGHESLCRRGFTGRERGEMCRTLRVCVLVEHVHMSRAMYNMYFQIRPIVIK